MKTEHDSFLAYYLTKDDESAMQLKELRASLNPYEVPDEQEVRLLNCSPIPVNVWLIKAYRKPCSNS